MINEGKIEFETFKEIGSYEIHNLEWDKPDCFNSIVRVRKYKVTIEQIDEPIEVIHERLENLWINIINWHDREVLEREAKKYKYEFKGEFGSNKKE